MSNNFIIDGSIVISNTDTPTRAGQRIASLNDLETVPNPFVGMLIFVEELDSFIYVKSLKSKKIGEFDVNNVEVDNYQLLIDYNKSNLNWNEVL